MTISPANLIPYYLMKNKLSVSTHQRKDLSKGTIDVNMRIGARVVEDCLVVEPVADVYGSACKICNKYSIGADGLYRGDTCGHLDCGLRFGVLEALGISPDAPWLPNYGWRVSGTPFSVFVKLNRVFRCQVYRLEGEDGDGWAAACVPLIRTEHARMFQTLMALRSIHTLNSNMWLLNQLYSFPHGVALRRSEVNNARGNMVVPQDVEEVAEILSRVSRVEVAP